MHSNSETLKQDLDHLSNQQLQQVDDFIAFLKFKESRRNQELDPDLLAMLASEFAEEDKALAEEGISDFAAILEQEDRL